MTPPSGSAKFNLFLVSALVLFLELACIRWFPAHVLYLTFFTNAVLLATFVGMSIGCVLAKRPTQLLLKTPMLLALALGAGLTAEGFKSKLERHVDVASQKQPEVVFYGAEVIAQQEIQFTVPAEVLFGIFFVLIAATLIGPGQEMGRAFNAVPNRFAAYAANLLGSLAGIALFTICSWLQLPPLVWFGILAVAFLYLLRGETRASFYPAIVFLIFVLAIVAKTSGIIPLKSQLGFQVRQIWSPYYRIDFSPEQGFINTNQIGHQLVQPTTGPSAEPYALPYLFQRDVKDDAGRPQWTPFKRVLVIGAGSGNDIARALQWLGPDARIDAVDIDPVIQQIGTAYHPDRPYQDSRVTKINNDGRNFLRMAPDAEYDLVVFALIDSLVLQSGYSNLRLESYLYTLESFRDVRRVLKPTGVCTLYNFFRQGWISARLRDGLREAFGVEPVLLTNPPKDHVAADLEDKGFAMFFAGGDSVIGPLRTSFSRSGNTYWYPWAVPVPTNISARFSAADQPPPQSDLVGLGMPQEFGGTVVKPYWVRFRIADVDEVPNLKPATDDWPFLYTRRPMIPTHNVTGMILMLALSLGLYWVSSRYAGGAEGTASPDSGDRGLILRSFFLGAGFMLIETKAVVHMALLFGSTWTVNTVVFAAILVMSLAGTLLAAVLKPKNLVPYYALLFVTLAVNIGVPPDTFLGLAPAVQVSLSCLIAFAPVAVAGIIFSVSFSRTSNPDRMFGANVAGALVGGLAENASMLLGFRLLGLVAFAFYLFSGLVGNTKTEKIDK
jgi:hypothetical protein